MERYLKVKKIDAPVDEVKFQVDGPHKHTLAPELTPADFKLQGKGGGKKRRECGLLYPAIIMMMLVYLKSNTCYLFHFTLLTHRWYYNKCYSARR